MPWSPNFPFCGNFTSKQQSVLQICARNGVLGFIWDAINACSLNNTTDPIGPNATTRFYAPENALSNGGFRAQNLGAPRLSNCDPVFSLMESASNLTHPIDAIRNCIDFAFQTSKYAECNPLKPFSKEQQHILNALIIAAVIVAIILNIICIYGLATWCKKQQLKTPSADEKTPILQVTANFSTIDPHNSAQARNNTL